MRFSQPKIKQEAADYLMREGELTGAEYFAAMRGLPNALNGVEDMSLLHHAPRPFPEDPGRSSSAGQRTYADAVRLKILHRRKRTIRISSRSNKTWHTRARRGPSSDGTGSTGFWPAA